MQYYYIMQTSERVCSVQNKQQKLQLNKTCVNHAKQFLDQLGCA